MWRRFEKNAIFFRLLVVVVATLITAPYRICQDSRSVMDSVSGHQPWGCREET